MTSTISQNVVHCKTTQSIEICNRNIAYCEMIKSEVSVLIYNKDTRDSIKARSDALQKMFPDFRSAMLKDSKKKDLIETIVKVCNRSIEIEQERIQKLNDDLVKIEASIEKNKEYEKRQEFVKRFMTYENEYIKGFDSVREGIRQWDCLVSLAEDGYVHEGNIIEYGIDLSIPPEK